MMPLMYNFAIPPSLKGWLGTIPMAGHGMIKSIMPFRYWHIIAYHYLQRPRNIITYSRQKTPASFAVCRKAGYRRVFVFVRNNVFVVKKLEGFFVPQLLYQCI